MEKNLPATDQQFSLSISLFILIQGTVPLLWTAISEVKGRKVGAFFFPSMSDVSLVGLLQLVYLISVAFFSVASIAVALSTNAGL